jgi:preprotein translocase subunit SecF
VAVIDRDEDDYDDAGPATPSRPAAHPDAMGRGRVVPPTQRPVNPSTAAGRAQPTRQPRSKRGKK